MNFINQNITSFGKQVFKEISNAFLNYFILQDFLEFSGDGCNDIRYDEKKRKFGSQTLFNYLPQSLSVFSLILKVCF